MLYTEQSARANIRNREGRRVFYLASGDQLTPGARDWLRQEKIDILPASEARPERFELLGGGYIEEKPEHMTHLNSQVLVDKTHPRIAFRGALDTLEAELILCQLVLEKELAQMVGEVLELARQIIRCDVLEEPLISEKLCGLTENEQRQRSHRPQEFYAQAHFMPEYTDGIEIARLNRARCAAREAELKAVAAFRDVDGKPTRPDILQAMNRMSSMLYILMIRMKSKR